MSYRELVLLQKPTFYLPFEETSGETAADITGNGFDGTYNNVSLSSATGFAVFGGPVTCATWNGTSSYVSIPKRWLRGGAVSLSGWFKPNSITGWRQLMHITNCNTSVAGPAFYASTGSGGFFGLVNTPFNGSSVFVGTPSAVSSVNELIHFAVTAIGGAATVYKNGVPVISYENSSGSFAPASTVLPMVIGGGYASSSTVTDFFSGWISHIAGWDRVLAADEVLRQYNVGKSAFDQPYVSGTVLDNGVGAAKRIKWMRRDSGVLVAAGSSASDGSFTLKTTSDVGMAVCLDDAATNYSPLIYDRVTPQT